MSPTALAIRSERISAKEPGHDERDGESCAHNREYNKSVPSPLDGCLTALTYIEIMAAGLSIASLLYRALYLATKRIITLRSLAFCSSCPFLFGAPWLSLSWAFCQNLSHRRASPLVPMPLRQFSIRILL